MDKTKRREVELLYAESLAHRPAVLCEAHEIAYPIDGFWGLCRRDAIIAAMRERGWPEPNFNELWVEWKVGEACIALEPRYMSEVAQIHYDTDESYDESASSSDRGEFYMLNEVDRIITSLERLSWVLVIERLPCRGCGRPLDHETSSAYCTKCPITATEVLEARGELPERERPDTPENWRCSLRVGVPNVELGFAEGTPARIATDALAGLSDEGRRAAEFAADLAQAEQPLNPLGFRVVRGEDGSLELRSRLDDDIAEVERHVRDAFPAEVPPGASAKLPATKWRLLQFSAGEINTSEPDDDSDMLDITRAVAREHD